MVSYQMCTGKTFAQGKSEDLLSLEECQNSPCVSEMCNDESCDMLWSEVVYLRQGPTIRPWKDNLYKAGPAAPQQIPVQESEETSHPGQKPIKNSRLILLRFGHIPQNSP